jgi:hypothetical protein
MNALPDALFLPALQPAMGGGVIAILLGHTAQRAPAPGAASTEDREDGIEGAAVVGTRATSPITGREERLEDRPLGISQVSQPPILPDQWF